jgi:Fe-S oxidoreductase
VRVLPIIGAGASLLSKGLIDAAKHHAEAVLNALNQLDPQHAAPIVGIEPPEIYTLKNDYRDLLPDRADEIASLSTRAWLLDEYILRSDDFSKLRVGTMASRNTAINGIKQTIKFLPHCHQRAEGLAPDGLPSGTNATIELLRLFDFDVEVLDTGCCGMAGTFGYEAEHYDLSMQVGELKLFPLLREAMSNNENTCVAGTGAACRMQIVQGVGMDVRHPIEIVRDEIQRMQPEKV